MSNFIDLATKRYSCRNYSERPVGRDEIMQVLDAARLAPSACNKQPWTFYVVSNSEVKAQILSKSRPAFVVAPITIVAVGHHDQAWHRPADDKDHTDVDLSIAVEHICLAAAELGLGTCWICSFDTDATRKALDLNDNEEPIALISLGYPADTDVAPEKKRKEINEIVKWVD